MSYNYNLLVYPSTDTPISINPGQVLTFCAYLLDPSNDGQLIDPSCLVFSWTATATNGVTCQMTPWANGYCSDLSITGGSSGIVAVFVNVTLNSSFSAVTSLAASLGSGQSATSTAVTVTTTTPDTSGNLNLVIYAPKQSDPVTSSNPYPSDLLMTAGQEVIFTTTVTDPSGILVDSSMIPPINPIVGANGATNTIGLVQSQFSTTCNYLYDLISSNIDTPLGNVTINCSPTPNFTITDAIVIYTGLNTTPVAFGLYPDIGSINFGQTANFSYPLIDMYGYFTTPKGTYNWSYTINGTSQQAITSAIATIPFIFTWNNTPGYAISLAITDGGTTTTYGPYSVIVNPPNVTSALAVTPSTINFNQSFGSAVTFIPFANGALPLNQSLWDSLNYVWASTPSIAAINDQITYSIIALPNSWWGVTNLTATIYSPDYDGDSLLSTITINIAPPPTLQINLQTNQMLPVGSQVLSASFVDANSNIIPSVQVSDLTYAWSCIDGTLLNSNVPTPTLIAPIPFGDTFNINLTLTGFGATFTPIASFTTVSEPVYVLTVYPSISTPINVCPGQTLTLCAYIIDSSGYVMDPSLITFTWTVSVGGSRPPTYTTYQWYNGYQFDFNVDSSSAADTGGYVTISVTATLSPDLNSTLLLYSSSGIITVVGTLPLAPSDANPVSLTVYPPAATLSQGQEVVFMPLLLDSNQTFVDQSVFQLPLSTLSDESVGTAVILSNLHSGQSVNSRYGACNYFYDFIGTINPTSSPSSTYLQCQSTSNVTSTPTLIGTQFNDSAIIGYTMSPANLGGNYGQPLTVTALMYASFGYVVTPTNNYSFQWTYGPSASAITSAGNPLTIILDQAWTSAYPISVNYYDLEGANPSDPIHSLSSSILINIPVMVIEPRNSSAIFDFNQPAECYIMLLQYPDGSWPPSPSTINWTWAVQDSAGNPINATSVMNTCTISNQSAWGSIAAQVTASNPDNSDSIEFGTSFIVIAPTLSCVPSPIYMLPGQSLGLTGQLLDINNNVVDLTLLAGTNTWEWSLLSPTNYSLTNQESNQITLGNTFAIGDVPVGTTLLLGINCTDSPSITPPTEVDVVVSAQVPSFSLSASTIYVLQSTQITVTITDINGNILDPTQFTWNGTPVSPYMGLLTQDNPTSQPNVFTYYPQEAGITYLTITAIDNTSGIPYIVSPMVTVNPLFVSVDPDPAIFLINTSSATLTGVISDASSNIILPDALVQPVIWSWQWNASVGQPTTTPPPNTYNYVMDIGSVTGAYPIYLTVSTPYASLSLLASQLVIVSAYQFQLVNPGEPVPDSGSTTITYQVYNLATQSVADPTLFKWIWDLASNPSLGTLTSGPSATPNVATFTGGLSETGVAVVLCSVVDSGHIIIPELPEVVNPNTENLMGGTAPPTVYYNFTNVYAEPLGLTIMPSNPSMSTGQQLNLISNMIDTFSNTLINPQPGGMLWVWSAINVTTPTPLIAILQDGSNICQVTATSQQGVAILQVIAYDPSIFDSPIFVDTLAAMGIDLSSPTLYNDVANLLAAGNQALDTVIKAIDPTSFTTTNTINVNVVVCVAPDTRILMADRSHKLIQHIVRGDRVASDPQTTIANCVSRVNFQSFPIGTRIDLVKIPENSLGPGLPNYTTIITRNHPLVYKGARRPAKCLTRLPHIESIRNQPIQTIITVASDQRFYLYDLQFDSESTYVANGLVVQSRSPYSNLTPLPRELYFDPSLYRDTRVWDQLCPLLPLKLNKLKNKSPKRQIVPQVKCLQRVDFVY